MQRMTNLFDATGYKGLGAGAIPSTCINSRDGGPDFLGFQNLRPVPPQLGNSQLRGVVDAANKNPVIISDWGKRSQAVREPVGWKPELSQAVGRAE